MSHLQNLGSGNLSLKLLQHRMNSLRAGPYERTDDLSGRLLGEGELPGGHMLQVEHQLSEIQLPALAGCPIGHLDGHLRCGSESVRSRGSRGNNVFTALRG